MEKVLLISPAFFDYEKNIIKELEDKGYEVTYFNSNLKKNVFDKFKKFFNKKYYFKKLFKCLKNTFEVKQSDGETSDENKVEEIKFSKIIIIFSPFMSKEAIDYLRCKNDGVKVIYYNWDSVKNFPSTLEIKKASDIAYSFDKDDVRKYGFKFLPLFYCENNNERCDKYDYCMIFSIYPWKVENYLRIRKSIPSGKKIYKNIYCPKLMYYYYRFTSKEFKKLNKNEISFKPLNREETYKIFSESKVIVDCVLKNQTGLTMRTFETLGISKKLLTTNKNIKDYPFYNENNIRIVDEHIINDKFFKKPFIEIEGFKEEYSIKSFINKLLGENKNE